MRASVTGLFGIIAYSILGIVFIIALGVFFYGRILASSVVAKDAALASAEASIDPATVENFVRLRNRLNASAKLLGAHPAFSGFFSTFEKILPSTVRFISLHLSRGDTGAAKVDGSGIAASFNALAAASNAFASDGTIKDAIFSNISVNRDGSVSFVLSATLDPKLIAFTAASATAAPVMSSIPAATSTLP